MLIRLLGALLAVALILTIATASAVMQKSMLTWPVAAPTRVAGEQVAYAASGWTISSPFGWRPNHEQPGQWELHEGADLAGPMFCDGCAVPPLGDVEVAAVGWDQPYAAEPQLAGAGVVVDMQLQHPEEAGTVLIRYGHLQPYQVSVRTQTCTQLVDCPDYQDDDAGAISVTCPGTVVATDIGGATRSYVYATPGECVATVSWPPDLTPDGPTRFSFDQQIIEGQVSSNAAITFRAQRPPPPTPTPVATPVINP